MAVLVGDGESDDDQDRVEMQMVADVNPVLTHSRVARAGSDLVWVPCQIEDGESKNLLWGLFDIAYDPH